MAEMARFSDLPSEVVAKIMLLVPADCLVEFKLMNKFWYSCISTFIDNPIFVAKHLLMTKNQSSMSLLCFKEPSPCVDNRLIEYSLLTIIHDDDDGKKDHFITVTEDLTLPRLDMNRWDSMFHCDGLLLLANYGLKTMVLCNPTLKEFMILPKPKNASIESIPIIDFGHDSRNNKYKCVAIWLDHNKCCVQVYTVGSDSWKEINISQVIMQYIRGKQVSDDVCCGGVCYWCIAQDETEMILSFDMSNEKFRIIELPDFDALGDGDWDPEDYSLRLAVWNDSVVMCFTPIGQRILSIFILKKDVTGDYFWTGEIGPLEKHSGHFLPFWKNDEILMEVFDNDGKQHLVSCNIRTEELRSVDYDLVKNGRFYDTVPIYEKSLISIRR
ncbi:hypothetical protein CsatB_030886 [Cannabis sativa]